MTGLRNIVVGAVIVVSVLGPRVASAMEIQMFDQMSEQDQRAYVKYLVDAAQKVMIEEGHRDQVAKLRELFDGVQPATHRSVGETKFDQTLTKERDWIAEIIVEHLPFDRPSVETALVQTLVLNGVKISAGFPRRLAQAVREKPFWPKLPLKTT